MLEETAMLRSQLFTVRLWVERVDADHTETRGLVRHASSGESTYFRDWATLVAFLEQWDQFKVTDTTNRSSASQDN